MYLLQIELLAEITLPDLTKQRFAKVQELVFPEVLFGQGLIGMEIFSGHPICDSEITLLGK